MIPISELITEHHSLANDLARYDYASIAPLVAGFLTLPDYHANTVRLDALAHIACCVCAGKRTADREVLVRCAGRHFAGSSLVMMEDPVEDVFIGNVATTFGNFRIFRGMEESGDFYTERLLRPIEEPGIPEPLKPIVKHVRALLNLSEVVAERRGLARHTFGSGRFRGRLEIPQWRELSAAAKSVTFSFPDLGRLGISLDDIRPFVLTKESRTELENQATGHSHLERFPIVQFDNAVILAAPHAVTTSARRFIIEQLWQTGFLGFFEMLLHARQVNEWFGALRHNFRFEPMTLDLPTPPEGFPALYQTVMRFDTGKYAHLVLLDGNLSGQLTNAHEVDRVSEVQQEALDAHLVACSEVIKKLPHFNGGMTVVTRGGVGRGLFLGFKRVPEWEILFASLPDWYTLAGCEDMSALRMWRMSRQKRWAEDHGLTIQNTNGLLNLFAYWRENGWRFLLRDMPLSNPHKMLALEIDFLADVRKTVRQEMDEHSCRPHLGERWLRVQRRYPKAYFSKDGTASMYVAADGMPHGQLVGSIETDILIWWIVANTKDASSEGRRVIFQLWDCLLNWMERGARIIEEAFSTLPRTSVWIEINLMDLEQWADNDQESPASRSSSALLGMVSDAAQCKVVITVPAEFRNEFHVPENRAERALIGCVVAGVAGLAGTVLSTSGREKIVSAIIPNDQARFFHVVRTESLIQIVAETGKPMPDFVPEEDCAQSLIGLAAEVSAPIVAGKLRGEADCMQYLQKIAAAFWERIETMLGAFSRRSVIETCLSSLAELERDQEHWSMTARALLALPKDQTDVLRRAEERRGKRDIASLTNRLLIETAMYACPPSGGKGLPRAEQLELLAHLMNLISTANHRDAISGGFMQPEVHIFPNGEADVDEHFYESVMAPYTRALFTKSFRASASKYEQWFPNYERAFNPDADKTLNRMERPFREEFCVSIDQFVSIPHLLGRASVKQHELILEYDEQSFLSFLKDECNLATGSADEYLARFSLPSRRAWNKDLPPGCEENDVWPWRFRRQLSLLMRPLILITDTPHKRWLVYPPLVKRSVAYVIHGIEEAMFPAEHFRSRAMQRFCGEQANRQGNAFTNMVADEVERLGFSARRQVLMSELGVPAHVGDFGDVDVLAWKRGCPIVFVIECKYLRTATSIRDVVDRLADYRGKSDDSLGKHLRRLKWLQSNSTYVSALTAIPTSEIQFEGMLVTDDLVPMQFFAGSAISPRDVVSFDQLALRFDRNV